MPILLKYVQTLFGGFERKIFNFPEAIILQMFLSHQFVFLVFYVFSEMSVTVRTFCIIIVRNMYMCSLFIFIHSFSTTSNKAFKCSVILPELSCFLNFTIILSNHHAILLRALLPLLYCLPHIMGHFVFRAKVLQTT